MSSCPGRLEEISAFVDGELSAPEELALRRHLDTCEICSAWHTRLEELKTSIARCVGREPVPPALSERVLRLAPKPARGRAAAALLVLGSLAVLGTWSLLPATSFDETLLEDHHRLVSGATALDIPSNDPEVVAAELGDRLPFRVQIAGVAEARLRGGHSCEVQGRHAAYLQYEREGERVSVFVYPRSRADSSGRSACRTLAGESLCTFETLEQAVTVIASTDRAARAFRSAARVVR